MAGLAAVTSRIQIYATAATLTLPPAIVARMAATIDSISGGRFGVNLVTGCGSPSMSRWVSGLAMTISPVVTTISPSMFSAARPVGHGKSDFKGDFFTMNDCRVSPQPSVPCMKVICAGQSDAGMAFSAQYADFNFCFGKGVNTPTAFAPPLRRMKQAAEQTGRDVGSYVLFMVIADETDDAARAKWEHYKAGADEEALSWLTEQSQKDTRSGTDTNVRQMADPTSAVNINMGTLVGSYASVARMLDEVASVPGAEGVLLTLPRFSVGNRNLRRAHSTTDAVPRPSPCADSGGGMMTTLTARPEAITFDPQQSALIVVDMQNAYATPGGYLDLAGFDVSTTRPVIANIQTAVTAARAAGMLIIWFQNGWD